MKNLNSFKNKISEENKKISANNPSKLLAEFFNGEVVKVAEEYIHEP